MDRTHPLVGTQILINKQSHPFYSYEATVIGRDENDGTFLVEFKGGRQRYVSGMDFCCISGRGGYWTKAA